MWLDVFTLTRISYRGNLLKPSHSEDPPNGIYTLVTSIDINSTINLQVKPKGIFVSYVICSSYPKRGWEVDWDREGKGRGGKGRGGEGREEEGRGDEGRGGVVLSVTADTDKRVRKWRTLFSFSSSSMKTYMFDRLSSPLPHAFPWP